MVAKRDSRRAARMERIAQEEHEPLSELENWLCVPRKQRSSLAMATICAVSTATGIAATARLILHRYPLAAWPPPVPPPSVPSSPLLPPPPPPRSPTLPQGPLIPPPPVPSLPRSPQVPPSVVEIINRRFARGEPSNDAAAAGVYVRSFDDLMGLDGGVKARWQPRESPSIIARGLAGRISGSIINRQVPYYFQSRDGSGAGGFVVSPAVVQEGMMCSYYTDVASDNSLCSTDGNWTGGGCLPGCYGATRASMDLSEWCDSQSPTIVYSVQSGQNWACPWPPRNLKGMLEEHLRESAKMSCMCCSWPDCPLYNEVLLSADVWSSWMPSTIEAVFYTKSSVEAESAARETHARFLTTYNLDNSSVPLLELSVMSDNPFTVAPAVR